MLFALVFSAILPKKPLSPEPLLGYNTWNAFQGDINEDKVKRTADLMVEKGLVDAGYKYLIIDDGYLLKERDSEGKIIIDSAKFPSGMKALGDYVHERGLKFGMYNCAGTYTCMGLAGSFGHELTDAKTFAGYGADFLKYDYCYNPITDSFYAPDVYELVVDSTVYGAKEALLVGSARIKDDLITYIGNSDGEASFVLRPFDYDGLMYFTIRYQQKEEYRVMIVDINGDSMPLLTTRVSPDNEYNEVTFTHLVRAGEKHILTIRNDMNNEDIAHYSYARMADALEVSDRDIVFAVCEWGSNQPYKWAQDVGHMWRTSYDITSVTGSCEWHKIVENYETTVGLYNYSGENAYNDPDMLCIGLDGINYDENLAHMSLWAMTNSPLLIGADLTKIDNQYIDILKNEYMLRVNQDKLHKQALPVVRFSEYDVLLKPLDDGSAAILLFNKEAQLQTISYDLNDIYEWLQLPGFDENTIYHCYNVWDKYTKDITRSESDFELEIASHGVGFYIITVE